MGPQTGHLVGRAEELGSLDRVRAELDGGRSVAVLLVGEAGIGKTRLLTEFGARWLRYRSCWSADGRSPPSVVNAGKT